METNAELKFWGLDRALVLESVKTVSAVEPVPFPPEEYYSKPELRNGILEQLSDKNFGFYVEAFTKLQEFSSIHPQMVADFRACRTLEELHEARNKWGEDPSYQDYMRLSDKLTTERLKLTINKPNKILDISATYSRLANIIYPEVLKSEKINSKN